jgi:hypothetical protein
LILSPWAWVSDVLCPEKFKRRDSFPILNEIKTRKTLNYRGRGPVDIVGRKGTNFAIVFLWLMKQNDFDGQARMSISA